jgi:hypothetical protein
MLTEYPKRFPPSRSTHSVQYAVGELVGMAVGAGGVGRGEGWGVGPGVGSGVGASDGATVGAGVDDTANVAVSNRPTSVHEIATECSASSAAADTALVSDPSFSVVTESTRSPSTKNSSLTVAHASASPR